MRRLPFCLLALVGIGLAAPTSAQTLATADSLLALRDTSAAIAVYETLVKRNLRDAEAHYRAGRLYMTRHVPGTDLSPNRRKAEEHFRYATRFQPDSAKYWLALAELFRTEGDLTTRIQVDGLVARARAAARAHGSLETARVEYRIARIEWERYEQLAHRYFLSSDVLGVDVVGLMEDWQYTQDFFRRQARPDRGNPGEANLATAEGALRSALATEPRFVEAAGLLAVAFGEQGRWVEAYEMARSLTRAAPDSGRANAILGLCLARLGRWREAEAAFGRALDRMGPAERAPYENVGLILKEADSTFFAAARPAVRAPFDSLYWRVSQPLMLSPVNETRLEFFARLAYVIHRWSDPLRGYQGYEADRGAVYLRYGPPDIWAAFGRWAGNDVRDPVGSLEYERNLIVWVYLPSRLRFAFSLTPGFTRAVFAGDHRALYAASRNLFPARFDNVPLVRTLDTILVQTARFRADDDSLALLVVGAIPLRRMTDSVAARDLPFHSGALLTDSAGREVRRDRVVERVTGTDARELQYRSWRLALRPGKYLLRVEGHSPTLDRGARAMQPLDVPPLGSTGLALSDLLVATRVEPRDSTATRWNDFLIEPNAGRFEPGEPIGLLWEMYNLTADSAGTARYEVGLWITVEALDRTESRLLGSRTLAEIVGGVGDALGLTAVYQDRISLGYRQERRVAAGGAQAEHLMVNLVDAPAGRYRIDLIVHDLVTGREAAASRPITIGSDPVRRGGF